MIDFDQHRLGPGRELITSSRIIVAVKINVITDGAGGMLLRLVIASRATATSYLDDPARHSRGSPTTSNSTPSWRPTGPRTSVDNRHEIGRLVTARPVRPRLVLAQFADRLPRLPQPVDRELTRGPDPVRDRRRLPARGQQRVGRVQLHHQATERVGQQVVRVRAMPVPLLQRGRTAVSARAVSVCAITSRLRSSSSRLRSTSSYLLLLPPRSRRGVAGCSPGHQARSRPGTSRSAPGRRWRPARCATTNTIPAVATSTTAVRSRISGLPIRLNAAAANSAQPTGASSKHRIAPANGVAARTTIRCVDAGRRSVTTSAIMWSRCRAPPRCSAPTW